MRSARRPSWFLCLVLASVLAHTVLNGVRALMSYRALALGADELAIGVITAAFGILPLLLALRIGRAIDRGHGLRTVRIGLILSVVAVLVAAVSPTVLVLVLASALLGLAQMFHTVACQSVIPLWCPPDQLDEKFGQLTLGVSVGQLLGPLIAGLVTTLTNTGDGHVATTPALLIFAVISMLAVPFAYAFPPVKTGSVDRAEHARAQQSTLAILRRPGMKPAMYSSLTVLTAMDLLTAYLPVLGQKMGLSVAIVTGLLATRALMSVISRSLLPLLLRTFPRRWLLIGSTLISAIPMTLLPHSPAVILMAIAMLVMGLFWGAGQPLTMAWVVTAADPNNRAAALAIRLAANRLGQISVPVVAGAVAGIAGVATIFYGSGLLLISASAITYRATRPAGRRARS